MPEAVEDEIGIEQPDLLTTEASGVVNNTICIKVDRSRFGTKRRANTDAVTVAADKTLLRLSKTILESEELKKVQQLDAETANYLRRLCLPSMFRGGIYLIPIGLVEEVNTTLETVAARRLELVQKAVDTYEVRAQETAARLKILAGEVPSKEKFAQSFLFEWQFVTWETPTRLKSIRKSLFDVERKKAAAKLSAVADECRNAMRAGMADMVAHMVDRLTPEDDGKKKRFQEATIKNWQEFFRTFEMKDVTGDHELAAVVAKARDVLNGVDVKDLRENDALRTAMQQQFAILKQQMIPMVVDRGTRVIDLDDEPDEETEQD